MFIFEITISWKKLFSIYFFKDDDAFGVQEPLNEIEFGQGLVSRGKHYIHFDTNEESRIQRSRQLAHQIFHSPIVTLDNSDRGKIIVQPSNTDYELPNNVNLLTLAMIPADPEEGEYTYNL